MKYELRASSDDFLNPACYFPGDEEVGTQGYQSCNVEKYTSSVATVVGAAESYGLDIDVETFERWKRISVASNLLDVFLDESEDKDKAYGLYMQNLFYYWKENDFPASQVSSLSLRRLETAVRLMDNSVAVLPSPQRDNMVRAAGMIGIISRVKAECTDIHDYLTLLVEEGSLSGLIVYESASGYVRNQPQFDSFAVWCNEALQFGTLQDAFMDLKNDTEAGTTGVDFSILNCLKIAICLRKSFSGLTRHHLDRSATIRGLMNYRKFTDKVLQSRYEII